MSKKSKSARGLAPWVILVGAALVCLIVGGGILFRGATQNTPPFTNPPSAPITAPAASNGALTDLPRANVTRRAAF